MGSGGSTNSYFLSCHDESGVEGINIFVRNFLAFRLYLVVIEVLTRSILYFYWDHTLGVGFYWLGSLNNMLESSLFRMLMF